MMTTDYHARTFWQQYAEEQLEEEILEMLLTSKHLRLNLGQLARSYGVPFEIVEHLANSLAEKHLKVDIERLEYEAVIKQIERLEQREKDAGVREWKLQVLARKYKRTPRQLMDVYNKAVCQRSEVKPMSVAQFRQQHSQEVDWLIQGWLPKGSTLLLHAEGGVGKTLFAYEILEAVAQGKAWNGYATTQGPVLLVQSDEPSLVTAERMDIRGIHDTDPVHILPEWQVESMPMLEAWVEEHKPALVIVDSLTAINRHCIFSENDTEYARPLLQLASMANRHSCTVIIIHHSNAEGNSRGTRATFNSVSEVWGLSNVDFKERLLRVQKTRLGRPPGRYKFLFDDDNFSFRYLGEDSEMDNEEALTQEERIRLWLADDEHRGTLYAPVEISEALGIGREATRRALRELWAKGLIRRMKRRGSGYYSYYVAKIASIAPLNAPEPTPHEACKEQAIEQAIGNQTPIALLNPLKSSPGQGFKPQAINRSDTGDKKIEKVGGNSDRLIASPPQPQTQPTVEADLYKRSEPIEKRSNENAIGFIENKRNIPLQKGTECEALVGGYWVAGKYLGEKGMKFYKPTRTLELVYRVETKAGVVDVFKPDFRLKEQGRET